MTLPSVQTPTWTSSHRKSERAFAQRSHPPSHADSLNSQHYRLRQRSSLHCHRTSTHCHFTSSQGTHHRLESHLSRRLSQHRRGLFVGCSRARRFLGSTTGRQSRWYCWASIGFRRRRHLVAIVPEQVVRLERGRLELLCVGKARSLGVGSHMIDTADFSGHRHR